MNQVDTISWIIKEAINFDFNFLVASLVMPKASLK